jgi:2-keto-4-pentenoate hydratase/2-oxohepta-3-ene-1,7-dioic acid hydratase in catechol pathway
MWYKPSEALANPGIIPIPKQAQDNFLDFEGELTIVTSKAAKNISVEEAPFYILGYTIGNDLTARHFQAPALGGGQFSYAKSFDNFAPLGPAVLSQAAFGDLAKNTIKTSINGRVVQNSPLDLIWGPAELVSFLSQGRTLPAGTAIMTGTPAGVGWFQEPQYSLKDGDVVDVSISGIGTLSNTMTFE